MNTSMSGAKRDIRERVWRLLEERGVARFPLPLRGRIPNFVGAEEAAERLFRSKIWRDARAVKVNPDSPQRPVRLRALMDGKTLVVPTPRIRDGFLLLDPAGIPRRQYRYASSIAGSYVYGRRIEPEDIPGIDLIVMGSVAVSVDGWRLGKGEGYAEIEYAVLRMLGKVGEGTPVATTVHELQIVPEIPHTEFDVPLDYIFTDKREIEAAGNTKPRSIIWSLLPEEKLREIPLLKRLRVSGTVN